MSSHFLLHDDDASCPEYGAPLQAAAARVSISRHPNVAEQQPLPASLPID